MTKRRKPVARVNRLLFGRSGALWLPQVPEPAEDSEGSAKSVSRRFDDKDPASFVQIEQTGRGQVLNRFNAKQLVADLSQAEALAVDHTRVCRVRAEFDKAHVFDYTITPNDAGRIRFIAGGVEVVPSRSVVENVYVRSGHAKREKVLNRIVLHGIGPTFCIHRELERLGRFFAVDSNTASHPEGKVLVTSICEGFVKVAGPEHAVLSWEYVRTLLFPAPKQRSEQVGWALSLSWLQANGLIDPRRHMGLIVDCDLGRLDDYAGRHEEILPGWKLPSFVTLVYATANAGTREFLPNKMIAAADTFNRAGARRARQKSFVDLWPAAKPGLSQICSIYVAKRPAVEH